MTARLKTRGTAWLAALAAVLLFAVSVGSVFVNVEPHRFSDSECFNCHFTLPEGGGAAPSFVDEITVMCTRCHEVSPLSHVVDISPMIPIPDGMPLSDRGTMTCVTCHDPHTSPTDPVTGGKTYFLRGSKPGKPLCLRCHEDPNQPGELAIFSNSGEVTHRRSMDKSHGFARFDVTDPSVELDPLSASCIGCHDSGEGEPNSALLGAGIWDHGGGIGRSHPIGADYGDEAWNNDELVRLDDLDKRIMLFDGRIGCCTCHNMYQTGGGISLTIGTADNYQELCFACHIK